MILSRKWIRDTTAVPANTEGVTSYIHYDAGSWFAELIGDEWRSYSVIRRTKITDAEWSEELQAHEVPRLPHPSFSVEQSPCRILHSTSFQLPNWTVAWSAVPQIQPLPPQPLEDLGPFVLPVLPQGESPAPPFPPPRKEQGYRRGNPGSTTLAPSSNQTSRVPRRREYRESQEAPPQSRNSGRHAAPARSDSVPIEHWTTLQLPEIRPGQPPAQAASSGYPRERQTYSPQQPRRPPRRGPSMRSNVVDGRLYQPGSSACQIQE